MAMKLPHPAPLSQKRRDYSAVMEMLCHACGLATSADHILLSRNSFRKFLLMGEN
jgi:hypothetical protein